MKNLKLIKKTAAEIAVCLAVLMATGACLASFWLPDQQILNLLRSDT